MQQRIRQVAHRARGLVRLYGISCFVAVVCLTALLVGWIDYLVRLEDLGLRLICLALLSVITMWGFARFIIVAWRYRCSDLHAAWQIERLYPDLGDRLTSAMAFAAGAVEDEQAGSAELRRAVITEAEAATGALEFDRCFDRRQPVRALMAAGISVAVLIVLVFIDGPAVSLAAKRLLVPWGHHPWPRRHVLQWEIAPTRLAIGQDFEVKLGDAHGQLPEHAEMHYWFEGDDASQIQTYPMQALGTHLVHRLANVNRPFRYRAAGGDDDTMLWRDLTLVEPPRIAEREITLFPPAYTGLESRQANGSFRALVGTRVTLRGRTSKPLSAARLETDTVGGHATIDLTLERDRLGFVLPDAVTPWVIQQSGVYGIRLIDEDGLDVGVTDEWDVHAVRDLPPTVSLKRPAADLLVTPVAQLSLEAIVKDDLAVRCVQVLFLRSASADQRQEEFTLWAGPDQVVPQSVRATIDGDEGVQRTVQHQWDLTTIPSMKPGEWIDFRVAAVDYKRQAGESATRRLTFVSSEELAERIAQRQSELLTQLAEIARIQRDTHTRTADLEIQVREAANLSQADVDQLQVAELNQRQIQQRLGHPNDGIAAQILALMEQARSNRLESSALLTRLRQFSETLQQLNDDPLATIQHQLVDAMKIVRECPLDNQGTQRWLDDAARDKLTQLFERVGGGQQRVVETLEELLGRMSQWDNYQRLAREVGRLKREQESVHARTQQLRAETLTEDPNDLTAQQRASLKRMTQRQNDVALRFGTLASGMASAQQKLVKDDPLSAATLADALEMVRRDGIGGLMRDIGREMDRNRLGQAVDQQETAIELLGQLQDVLANRREQQLDRTIDQLRQAAAEIDRMRDRQRTVQQETAAAAQPTREQFRRWDEEEGDLSQQVGRLAQQLRRQGVNSAESSLSAAGEQLRAASQGAQAGDLAKARRESSDAQSSLDEARQKITASLEETREAFQDERIAHLRQSVREFLARQQRLIDETQQAESQRPVGREAQNALWQQTVQTLAGDQEVLSQDVNEIAGTLEDVVSFAFALQRATRCMTAAAQSLASDNVGTATVELQRQAAEQLQQLLTALVEEPPRERSEDEQADDQDAKPGDGEQGAARYVLAQLKLVRAMQQQLNGETESLERAAGPWDAKRIELQQDLVRRQRGLAEIVRQLLDVAADAPKPAVVRPEDDGLESLDRVLEREGEQQR